MLPRLLWLLIVFTTPSAFGQDKTAGIEASADPEGGVAPLRLKIIGDAKSADMQLYLKNTQMTDLEGVRLNLYLAAQTSQMGSGITTSFQVGGVDIPPAGIKLVAGKRVPVTLRLSNMANFGTFQGSLLVGVKGELYKLTSVTLERYPQPALRVAGADAAGIKTACKETSFQQMLLVESINQTPVEDLQISLSPFLGPNGLQFKTEWKVNGQPGGKAALPVPGLAAIPLEISALLPLAGSYTGAITLVYAEHRESIPLSVTRTRSAPTVEILGPDAVAGSSHFCTGSADVWFSLHETAGQEVKLRLPELTQLTRKNVNQVKVQSGFNTLSINNEAGKKVTDSFVLKPGETKRLQLTIAGIAGAGDYTATLRIDGADTEALDKSFEILVKDSAWIAILFISLGVLLSSGLRYWVKSGKPQLVSKRRVAKLLEDIAQILDKEAGRLTTDEQVVLQSMQQRLESLDDDLWLGSAQDSEALINELEQKLRLFTLWVNARRRLDVVQDPQIVQEKTPVLTAARDFLRNPGIAGLDQQRQALQELDPQITQAERQNLQKAITGFQNTVNGLLPNLPPALVARMEQQVRMVLTDAQQAALADLTKARHLFNEARANYVALVVDDLNDRLTAQATPAWFPADKWPVLTAEVSALLKQAQLAVVTGPERAISLYEAAYTEYLSSLAEQLRKGIETDIRTAPEDLGQKLHALAQRLAAEKQQAINKQFAPAKQELEAVERVYQAMKQEIEVAQGGAQMGAGAQLAAVVASVFAAGHAIPPAAAAGQVGTVSPHQARPLLSFRKISRLLKVFEFLFFLVVVVIAVSSGLKVLWIDDPTWGGANAYLLAMLWGLGLHQVSGAAFDVDKLAARFAG